MALPICIEIPPLEDPFEIPLPGGISIEGINVNEMLQPALTPLMPVFNIIDTIVALFNCVKAIPDTLGPPPDPTVLAACIPELAKKVNKLLQLIPMLCLPMTVVRIIDLVIQVLTETRSKLLQLQQQMKQIEGAIDRAKDLNDAGLIVADHEKPRKPGRPGRSLSVGTTCMPSGSVRG